MDQKTEKEGKPSSGASRDDYVRVEARNRTSNPEALPISDGRRKDPKGREGRSKPSPITSKKKGEEKRNEIVMTIIKVMRRESSLARTYAFTERGGRERGRTLPSCSKRRGGNELRSFASPSE